MKRKTLITIQCSGCSKDIQRYNRSSVAKCKECRNAKQRKPIQKKTARGKKTYQEVRRNGVHVSKYLIYMENGVWLTKESLYKILQELQKKLKKHERDND